MLPKMPVQKLGLWLYSMCSGPAAFWRPTKYGRMLGGWLMPRRIDNRLPRPPKYILCPGYVTSRNDGQRHYITAARLARLYGVRYQECLIDDEVSHLTRGLHVLPGDVRLYPRYDGDYTLPPLGKGVK